MDDTESTQDRWLDTLKRVKMVDLNISTDISDGEEEDESYVYENESDLSWASKENAPKIWTSESDSEEEEECTDEEINDSVEMMQEGLAGMSLVEEEYIDNTSREDICEFGNFVIETVEEDSEEEVDSDSHKSMPEGESVDDWDLEGSIEGSSMNSNDWDKSSEEKEDSECKSSIGYREHIDYVNLEAEMW